MELRLRNIGGIRELELKIRRGVNLYTAPNSYGKTSLARAIVSLMTSKLQAEDLLNATSDEGYVEAKVILQANSKERQEVN
jgi:recombinational DNA repair ATPase RecF